MTYRRTACLAALFLSLIAGAETTAQDTPSLNDRLLSAHSHLRDGQLQQSLRILGTAVDQHPPASSGRGPFGHIAAAIHLKFQRLETEDRLELLTEWTFPSPDKVRVLNTLVPGDAPPPVFARALGERPREDAFQLAAVGRVSGLFSSAWLLVEAANEAAALQGLAERLEPLAERGVPNAMFVLTLSRIASPDTTTAKQLRSLLQQRASEVEDAFLSHVEQSKSPPTNPNVFSLTDLAIASAAVSSDAFAKSGTQLLTTLSDCSSTHDGLLRAVLRRAVAESAFLAHDVSPDQLDRDLQWWIPSRAEYSADAESTVPLTWVAHDGHLACLGGSGRDWLTFRYPLTGDFEFSCDVLEAANQPPGGLHYGGLTWTGSGFAQRGEVEELAARDYVRLSPVFLPRTGRPIYHRLTLKRTDDRLVLSTNGRRVWSTPVNTTTAPWIGLKRDLQSPSVFRNPQLTGSINIPKELPLTAASDLSGWLSGFFDDSSPLPRLFPNQNESDASRDTDWSIKDGVLLGRLRADDGLRNKQSRLYYFRPLQSSESITYDFYYSSGKSLVHPALGNLAFLFESTGVQLHWMTDNSTEWTGLTADNAIIDPFSRRGPRVLPLKDNDWNSVTVTLNDTVASILLNDTLVCEYELSAADRTTFGFYHDRTKTEARVRDVILEGNWPERLDAQQLNDLLATTAPNRTDADRSAIGQILNDRHLGDVALEMHRSVKNLPLKERYDALADWVLPGVNHNSIRLALEFTPTDPAPPAQESEVSTDSTAACIHSGGRMVAPALDLIEAAVQLERLADLKAQLDEWQPTGREQKQARIAFLVAIAVAEREFSETNRLIEELFALVEPDRRTDFVSRWSETLAIHEAARNTETRELARELAGHVYQRQIRQFHKSGAAAWDQWMSATMSWLRTENLADDAVAKSVPAPPQPLNSREWHSVSHATARTRGQGFPNAVWQVDNSRVSHRAGHDSDHLYYHIPLQGDFEVECDMTMFDWTDAEILIANNWLYPAYSRALYTFGDIRRQRGRNPIDRELSKFRGEMHFRGVVQDGVYTAHINGRPVHTTELPQPFDPWVAIRSRGPLQGTVRNLRVSGSPVIPKELRLSTSSDLTGWLSYFSTSVGAEESHWRALAEVENDSGRSDQGIYGRPDSHLRGEDVEHLLQYHRPMLENGTITYEFYYEDGVSQAHPALDRLAFLLSPDGVQTHWITDGVYDRTGLSRGNITHEEQNRRGPDELPLRQADWNQVDLHLSNDVVTLQLNGQPVFERRLEATNQRTFGFFYYSDRGDARVRNVRWRGDWLKTLPPVSEQQLADRKIEFLNKRLPDLTAVFEFDFADFFESSETVAFVGSRDGSEFQPHPDGLLISQSSSSDRSRSTVMTPGTALRGDFDISASFSDLGVNPDTNEFGSVHLRVILGPHEQVVYRRDALWRDGNYSRQVVPSITDRSGDSPRWVNLGGGTCEATGGTLRIARRGDRISYLFAENDSQQFRLFAEETGSTMDVEPNGVRLEVQQKGSGTTRTVWQRLTLRAEKMVRIDPNSRPRPVVFLMKPDGTGLRQITSPISDYPSQGSPAFSPDGRQVAFDCWLNGRADSSWMFVVPANGGEPARIAHGSMPVFSPDGKRIAFTSEQGMSIMNVDGTGREIVDRSGWGVQWSPDGKSLAYGYGGNIAVMNLETREKTMVLEDESARRYRYIYWNMCWSRDSQRVCFKGMRRTDSKQELAVVEATGSSQGFEVLFSNEQGLGGDIAWHPDGHRVLFPKNHAGSTKLFFVDRRKPGTAELWPDQPDMQITSVDWSRDGRFLAVTALPRDDWRAQLDTAQE